MLLRPTFTFIPPALPSPAERPPIGGEWVHEIKHDGYRMMVRRDASGVRRPGADAQRPTMVRSGATLARRISIPLWIICLESESGDEGPPHTRGQSKPRRCGRPCCKASCACTWTRCYPSRWRAFMNAKRSRLRSVFVPERPRPLRFVPGTDSCTAAK